VTRRCIRVKGINGRRAAAGVGATVVAGAAVAVAVETVDFVRGRRRVDQRWYDTLARGLERLDIGSTRLLEITPLVEWTADRDGLLTAPGVSYFVRTDELTLLFDAGLNPEGHDPAPLAHNAGVLGVPVEDVDAVFVSHAHGDHLGGVEGYRQSKVLLVENGVRLSRTVPLYCPVPLTGDRLTSVVCDRPRVIGPGVASTGAISTYQFHYGELPEHGLVVNVEGCGLVLVSGCGHPGLVRFLPLVEQVFGGPLYGFVGGLHLPVTDSRPGGYYGIPIQRVCCTGKPPWMLVTELDALREAAALRSRHVSLVALSPHDSCDWTMDYFERTFGAAFYRLEVGKTLRIAVES
jgi:7,8-dihydropterin-6-yl-methyl-4-(beta-D-ribofuranosyl)aminobenzene 5'-phosphate synthase